MKQLALTLFFFPLLVSAQTPAAKIDRYLRAQEQVNGFSGVVLVVQNDALLYRKAFGLANHEWKVPNTPATKFRIASITKQFTATAILQLAAQGKLSLNDPLSKFYPGFPRGDSVTIHMLLNHTSGIRSFTSVPGFGRLEPLPLPKDSILAIFRDQPYDFTPGTRYAYNNSGYFLLATIVEKLSGLDYETYLRTRIFNEAGLRETGMEKTDSIMTGQASGYRFTPAGWKKARAIAMEIPFGGGNLVSTVDDLLRWQKKLYGQQLLPDSLYRRMTTPYLNHYGYALDIDSLGTHRRIGHDGNLPGYASYSYYYPNDGLRVIVLSNRQGSLQWFGQALAGLVFGMQVELPYAHQEVSIPAGAAQPFAGVYQTPEGSRLELVHQNGKLYRKAGPNLMECKPESPTRYFLASGGDLQVYFETTGAYLVRDGLVSPLRKLNE